MNDLLQPNDGGILLLIGALSWFFKRQIGRYDKHIEDCNEFPKALIVKKLDELHESFTKMAEHQMAQSTQLATLIGRQIERDHQ